MEPNYMVLSFASVDDFRKALHQQPDQVGFFVPSYRRFKVGERVGINVAIAGVSSPVFLEGRVVWRRTQSGGSDMPAGCFIELVQRDRARLDAIITFLRSGGTTERRRQRRYPASFRAIYRTAKGDYVSEVRNISVGGAFLRCSGPLLTVGAKFPVVLYPSDGGLKGLELDAQVAWIDYFEDTQGMGISFVAGQSELRKVKRFVSGFEKRHKLHKRQ